MLELIKAIDSQGRKCTVRATRKAFDLIFRTAGYTLQGEEPKAKAQTGKKAEDKPTTGVEVTDKNQIRVWVDDKELFLDRDADVTGDLTDAEKEAALAEWNKAFGAKE